nr:SMI1/KNR4 family protein [Acinetobacter sp. NBRC 110496]
MDLINEVKSKIFIKLPKAYEDFLLICNGLYSQGNLTLHEVQDLPERNNDYEVEKYLPDYFMIGDDNGGQAVLINEAGEIFEVGMGVMDIAFVEQSANSLEDLLINYKGKTLNER